MLLVLTLGSAGCGEDLPPIRYETDKALIGTDFDLPLCEGDFDRLDAQIRFVEGFLDAASDEKIEIYVYENQPPDCPGLGCWNTELDRRWRAMSSTDQSTRSTVTGPSSLRQGT